MSKPSLINCVYRLVDLCGLKNKDQFNEKFVAQNVGLIDLVQMYKSLNLSFEFLIQKCDTIMPRYYTIASSAIVSPHQIKIAISLSTFTTVDGTKRYGLTSAYLKALNNGQGEAQIFIKDSNFDMNNNVPLLMVGPGTGIVPFIAFAEERENLKAKGD